MGIAEIKNLASYARQWCGRVKEYDLGDRYILAVTGRMASKTLVLKFQRVGFDSFVCLPLEGGQN